MDHENGILLLNLLADVWDLLEQYNLLYKESEMENESTHLKPTCTVMIKYMKDKNDIYFAHNAWHMYQAMSYRILKNYKLNYHVLPGSSVIIPGHTIAMSSYAGAVLYFDIHGGENLTTLLVKHFNDLLDVQSSERSRDEVTFF